MNRQCRPETRAVHGAEMALHRVFRHDARLRLSILQAPDRKILTAETLLHRGLGGRVRPRYGEITTNLTNVLYYLSLVAVLKLPEH